MLSSKKSITGAGVIFAACLLCLGLLCSAPAALVQPQEDAAKGILQAMSDYMSKLKTIELTFDSSIEIITPQLEKIQFNSSGEVLLSRPNQLRAHRFSGHADVTMYVDGKTATVYGKQMNGYAQFAFAGTLDQLIASLRAGRGVALPGADLLVADPYAALVAGVMEAKYLGTGIVDGVPCDHLAFRNFDTDWQLWVQAGDKPIPRKLIVTSKTMNCAPQHTIHVKSFKSGVKPPANAFTFVPPTGAAQLESDALIELDELPNQRPQGAQK
jgi:hypothetical protein